MAKITLARALKIKNRLGGRLAQVSSDIVTYNSQCVQPANGSVNTEEVKLQSPEINVGDLFEKREVLQKSIVTIKVMIANANSSIQKAIYEIAEAKGDITFYSGLATAHGFTPNPYGNGGTYRVAFKRKADIDQQKKHLEGVVDSLQEQIDKHNHTTFIDIPDEIMNLSS